MGFVNTGSTTLTTGIASENSSRITINTGCNNKSIAPKSSCVIQVTKTASGGDAYIGVPYTQSGKSFEAVGRVTN